MTSRTLPFGIGTLLLTLALAAAACGGGGSGSLTLEEYFAELEVLDDEFETRSNEIELLVDTLTDEDFLVQAPDLVSSQADIIDRFLDGLEALDAPEEAAAFQEEAVSAGREVVELLRGLVDDVAAAGAIDEVFALLDQDELNAAIDRFDQLCLDASQLAADNAITVDLNCEE